MFALKGVTYKDILDIDALEIHENQTTAIIGESGSGKSTLLKLLNHMISPDSGEVLFNGEPIDKIDAVELRRQVVMLAQQPALFGDTVKENLEAGLGFSEKPSALDEQMKEALQKVNLHKGLDEEAEKLSGGEQQRLALARVMLMDPPVFLLDEPTSALDEDMEQLVMEHFFDYARANDKTVVMVTHATKIAERFADRLIEIEPFSKKVGQPS
ncbi:MAG TPA: ATP-binding cassette domain-containing protein [Bacillales bacterium]|nr:ATP-binding cassette domain-containing protein [Bacillales bacterium]